MKTLTSITQDAQSTAFDKHGAFFAFSNAQFSEKAQKDVEYRSLGGMGLICPKDNCQALVDELSQIHNTGIAKDKEIHSDEEIILRELRNYECFYTCEIEDAVEALADYGFSYDEIHSVYRANFTRFAD